MGTDLTEELIRKSIDLYNFAEQRARSRGIILADTKFEFGILDGESIVIDEIFTPDSSRFWPASEYRPGGPQPSFDKQYLRDYLVSVGWNKEPPPPALPAGGRRRRPPRSTGRLRPDRPEDRSDVAR